MSADEGNSSYGEVKCGGELSASPVLSLPNYDKPCLAVKLAK